MQCSGGKWVSFDVVEARDVDTKVGDRGSDVGVGYVNVLAKQEHRHGPPSVENLFSISIDDRPTTKADKLDFSGALFLEKQVIRRIR